MIDILYILLLTLILRDIGRYIGESIKRGFEEIHMNTNIDFGQGFIDGIEKMQAKVDYSNVDRFEVIDHRENIYTNDTIDPRAYIATKSKIDLSLQDDGKTLKVFINDKE